MAVGLVAAPAMGAPLIEAFNGYQLLQQRRFEQAEKAFRSGLELRPGSANLRSGLIQSILGQDQCERGVTLAWELRDKKAFNPNVADSIAACFSRALEFSEAVYWKSASIQIGRTTSEDYARLALFLFRSGEDEEAERVLEALETEHWRAWMTRAVVAVGRGKWEAADHALAMVDLLADEPVALRWIVAARLSLDLGDLEQAMEELERMSDFKGRSPQAFATRAEVYRRAGWLRDANAITLLRGPAYMRDRRWRMTVARVELDNGNIRFASKLIKAAVEKAPRDPEVVATAWYLAQHQGQTSLAAKFAEEYSAVQTSHWRTLESYLPVDRSGGEQ